MKGTLKREGRLLIKDLRKLGEKGAQNLIIPVIIVGVALIGGLGALIAHQSPSPRVASPKGTVSSSVSDTVTVTKQDIVLTITENAHVINSPEFTLDTPQRGPIDEKEIQVGSVVPAHKTIFTVNGKSVSIPVAAIFNGWQVPDGTSVPKNLPVANFTSTQFAFLVTLPQADAARLRSGSNSAKAALANGTDSFTCQILETQETQEKDIESNSAPTEIPILCSIPPSVVVDNGLSGSVTITNKQVDNALALPVTAVNASNDNGLVWLIKGSQKTLVHVGLGATDGSFVQITSGLQEGDVVAAKPPTLKAS